MNADERAAAEAAEVEVEAEAAEVRYMAVMIAWQQSERTDATDKSHQLAEGGRRRRPVGCVTSSAARKISQPSAALVRPDPMRRCRFPLVHTNALLARY